MKILTDYKYSRKVLNKNIKDSIKYAWANRRNRAVDVSEVFRKSLTFPRKSPKTCEKIGEIK